MIGFLIGTVCLLGLIKVVRHGHWGGHHRWAGWGHGGQGYGGGCGSEHARGCGNGGDGEHGPGFDRGAPPWARRGGGGFSGFGRGRFWLRGLFHQLDTTPGQEKVIKEAFEQLRATADNLRSDAKSARPDVAKAIRSEQFDETVFGEISARIDDAAQTMRRAVVDAVAKVHPVLDERQRTILADFIESGPRWGRHGGGSWSPYRSQRWT